MTAATPVRGLLGVDMRPTFCESGELPVAGGNAVCTASAEFTAAHTADYALTVFSQDGHLDPGDHFCDHPDYVDTWPAHGVAGTPGAQLHPALNHSRVDVSIHHGACAAA